MKSKNRNFGVLLAAAISAVIVLGIVALFTINRLAIRRGRTIDQVQEAAWNEPVLLLVVLVLALAWLAWLVQRYGIRHIASMIAAGVAVVLLVAAPWLAWQAATAEREITVTTMTCDPEALRTTGGDPLMDCKESPVDTIVHLSEVEGDTQWTPDAMEGNQVSTFQGLPGGAWDARLRVDGPAETTAVHVVDTSGDRPNRLATFRPRFDPETGRLVWSDVVRFPADADDIRVLFYLSPQPVVGAAKLTFQVRSCHGQTSGRFDASQCDPYQSSVPVVTEVPHEGARTWRYPHSQLQNGSQVMTNLEAREYTLAPDYTSIQMLTQSADVLIIPAPVEQVESNSITRPGESQFTIDIAPNTGPMEYVVYIFPSGPTYAWAD